MRVFTPAREVGFPVQFGDHLLNRLLRAGEPYILNDRSAATFDQLIRYGQVEGRLDWAEERPLRRDSKRVLVFWEGEEGDIFCTWPGAVKWVANSTVLTGIGIVSAQGDRDRFISNVAFEYPITLRQARHYDAWVEFDARETPQGEIADRFAEAIGVTAKPLGNRGDWRTWWATPISSICEETGRPKIGLSLYTDSHYRSWQAAHAYFVMLGLVEAGYDCYVIGSTKQRIAFKEAGERKDLWGEGMYDACGLFATFDETVAFVTCMDAMIAPDGGMLQVACALGKPTLGLFGPTLGSHRSKYGPSLRWLSGTMDCAPCWCMGDRPPCQGQWCDAILSIEPDRIVEEVKTMLEVPSG